MYSAVSLSSAMVHHRCPVMRERSSSSCPAVLTCGCVTRTWKYVSAAKTRRPLLDRHRPARVATMGPRPSSVTT
jgi:hypothetical protein